MTTLPLTHWRVLTYIQQAAPRACRNSEIQTACGLDGRAHTKDVLSYLEGQGLIQIVIRRVNGKSIRYARSNFDAAGSIGVSFENDDVTELAAQWPTLDEVKV